MPSNAPGYACRMERQSNKHGSRLDDAMEREVESLVRGAPIEARTDPGRAMEDAADGEPTPEAIIETAAPDTAESGAISHSDVRRRSELAIHLRPSVFPATRGAIVAVAEQEDAPGELLAALERLPLTQVFHTTEEVWEALGGAHEDRMTAPTPPDPVSAGAAGRGQAAEPHRHEPAGLGVSAERFGFRFDRVHRLLALPFGVNPGTAHVEVDRAEQRFVAQFGPWRVETELSNVDDATITGGYFVAKTAGPAHLSLLDRGLTFATNDVRGVCIRFRDAVRGIDPAGIIRHPALTVTVDDPDRLVATLAARETT